MKRFGGGCHRSRLRPRAARAAAAWAVAGSAAVGGGCAHVEAPPGGPVDSIPPALVRVVPAPLTVDPAFRGPVRFEFDERISERDVERSVLLAPAPGGVKVSKSGRAIEAEPRRGFRPGKIYHATLLPGVRDLFGNRTREPVELVFSTGPAIPDNALWGRVTDRVTGRRVRDVRVEARGGEGLVYVALSDSAGLYRLARIPEGAYRVVAFDDANQNLARDPYEQADSADVEIGAADTLRLDFRIVEPDTTPPALARAELADSVTVRLVFDDWLDPEWPADSAVADLVRERDGESVPVAGVRHGFAFERARRAAEGAAPDTTPAPAPLPRRELYLLLEAPLAPGTYEARVARIRNLAGLAGGGRAALVVEPPREGPP
jgi:hypothetical protein